MLPPLEHAPDQIASRPFETLSVIAVPAVNDADPLLPTETLMPAGLEVILWPLRPVAVTVSVSAPPGGGVEPEGITVSVAVRAAPDEPEIVTGVEAVTADVVTVKLLLVLPALIVTLDGTVAADVLLLESDTTVPPDGAALVRVAVPCDVFPPTTLDGLNEIDERVGAGVPVPAVTVRTAPQVVFSSA